MRTFIDTFLLLFFTVALRDHRFLCLFFVSFCLLICQQLLEGTTTEIRHHLCIMGLSSVIPVILICPFAFIVYFMYLLV